MLVIIFAFLSPDSANLKLSYRQDLCFKLPVLPGAGPQGFACRRVTGSQCKSGPLPHRQQVPSRTLAAQADFRRAEALPMW